LVEIDGSWSSTQGLEQAGKDRSRRHAHLKTLEIVRRLNLASGGGQLAEAVVPELTYPKNANTFDLAFDKIPEVAVHCLPNRIVGVESEAGIDDPGGWHQRGENRGGDVQIVNSAIAHLAK